MEKSRRHNKESGWAVPPSDRAGSGRTAFPRGAWSLRAFEAAGSWAMSAEPQSCMQTSDQCNQTTMNIPRGRWAKKAGAGFFTLPSPASPARGAPRQGGCRPGQPCSWPPGQSIRKSVANRILNLLPRPINPPTPSCPPPPPPPQKRLSSSHRVLEKGLLKTAGLFCVFFFLNFSSSGKSLIQHLVVNH